MISANTNCCRWIRSFLFVSVFLVGLVANWVTPASAGSGTFTTTGSMSVPRMDHTATLLANGEVLVTGGTNNSTGYLSSAELYSPSTGTWTLTANMTAPRDGHDAVLLHNGRVLVAGGINASLSQCGTLASAELYDPATGTWSATGSMTTGRYSFTLTLLANGEVLAAGGTDCGNGGLTSAELYNPATGKWTATGSMAVGNETNWAVLLQNGKVLVLNDNLYNPTTGTWTAASKDAIFAHAPVVLLPNGDVYAGGTIQGDSVYNPSTNQWTNFSPPPCTTIHQSCESGGVLLLTGRVLVGGGATLVPARPYPIEETNGLACLFDPSTLTWTTTGSMSTSRFGESMTVLPSGQVLVAGGDTFNKQTKHLVQTTSAELYTP